jgi:cadmium resistance protein CadD (predicted permease)
VSEAFGGSLVSASVIAVTVYALTNIDDLLLLAVFFADPAVRIGAVVVGRYLGLLLLLGVSVAAALLALAISPQWVALIGIVPLLLGLRLLVGLRRPGDDEHGEGSAAPSVTARRGFWMQAMTVGGVTVANGGDNLGVYIPLFAAGPAAIAVYIAIFSMMTVLWCALGYALVNNPLLGHRVRRYGHVLLPVVLVGLGLYVLSGFIFRAP